MSEMFIFGILAYCFYSRAQTHLRTGGSQAVAGLSCLVCSSHKRMIMAVAKVNFIYYLGF